MADLDVTIVTKIEGLDELEEAFTNGAKRAVKKFLRSVEFKATKPLLDSAKQFAPKLTGNLELEEHRQTVTSDGALTVRVGPSSRAFYGMFQEFGTQHIPALHWLENSARAVQDQVLETYFQALTDGLQDMKK